MHGFLFLGHCLPLYMTGIFLIQLFLTFFPRPYLLISPKWLIFSRMVQPSRWLNNAIFALSFCVYAFLDENVNRVFLCVGDSFVAQWTEHECGQSTCSQQCHRCSSSHSGAGVPSKHIFCYILEDIVNVYSRKTFFFKFAGCLDMAVCSIWCIR